MFSRAVSCVLALVAGGFTVGLPSCAFAGLQIISQSVQVDRKSQEAHFVIHFNEPPLSDLLTIDSFGRPAGSFQYEIDPDWSGDPAQDPLAQLKTIIRGDEIREARDLRVRDASPSVPEPIAGGWGKIRGKVPFEITGNTFTFSTPLTLLDDHDGVFGYRVFSTQFGETSTLLQGKVIPLPTAAPAAAILLLYLLLPPLRRCVVGQRKHSASR